MTLESVAAWLENLPLPLAIRESASLFPGIETVHVLALAIVIGSISTLDLRLLGVIRRDEPAWLVADKALPWTWTAFTVAVISGSLLFSSAAVKYVGNPFIMLKFVLLLLAGLNMIIFQWGAGRRIAEWPDGPTPLAARIAAALSLVLWIGVVVAGRWIGFLAVDIGG